MARWRPPSPKSSPYITPEGESALKTELKELWQLRRREVVPALQAAAAEGDRSENAEYIYRKKQLGQIDRRVRYLSKRLDVVEVVVRKPPNQDRIHFGALVTLEKACGGVLSYRIVGADEIDPRKSFISVDSPVARSLLGKTVGEEVDLPSPEGTASAVVLGVEYV
ncbi:MAG: transcription elongation factor GreB [Xanthomonadales bacterium]|nr:transcription elongation factor GreB [Gammaproteobacteria bacterium]MBT8052401.1 transcription elongation factor GreB [Gammaproteobacteria bacterium]NND55714.1 transcription elongation factor GreB [Xanthomonadales bacterium]NNK52274.1 transcription elongation factor GreB [Xanthomonadales bacterium]